MSLQTEEEKKVVEAKAKEAEELARAMAADAARRQAESNSDACDLDWSVTVTASMKKPASRTEACLSL